MEGKHTGGKWEDVGYDCGDQRDNIVYISSTVELKNDICDLYHKDKDGNIHIKENAKANAKRIVACVNALNSISNEALESGAVEALLKMYDFAKHGDDLLLFGLTYEELDALAKLEV